MGSLEQCPCYQDSRWQARGPNAPVASLTRQRPQSSVRQGQTHMALQLRDCRHVLLLVAHPDDESMFFSPTIAGLTAQGTRIAIACLCSGQLQPPLPRALLYPSLNAPRGAGPSR